MISYVARTVAASIVHTAASLTLATETPDLSKEVGVQFVKWRRDPSCEYPTSFKLEVLKGLHSLGFNWDE